MSESYCREIVEPPTKTFRLFHFVKAFDKVRHNEVLEALDEAGIDDNDLRLLQNIYWKQKATVRVGDEETGVFDIKIGVRQGCVASPILYNTFSEKIQ